MGESGDYWRDHREHRRRQRARKRKGWCECGHVKADHLTHSGTYGACDRFGSCFCYAYVDQVTGERAS